MRKILIIILALILPFYSQFAAKYYFSNSHGSDGYTLSQAKNINTPFKSISKLNDIMNSIKPGDSILFKRGEVFTGQINLTISGTALASIHIDSYGSGNLPIITGSKAITGWSLHSGKIWLKNIESSERITNIFINGLACYMGRYPNTNDTNGGYLKIQSHSGNNEITCNSLSDLPDCRGGEIVIKTRRWLLESREITLHNDNVITFKAASDELINNYGFFIQNHISTLDQSGEWFHDIDNGKLYLFSNTDPNNFNVEITAYQSVFYAYIQKYISISNIQFKGSLHSALVLNNVTNCIINNCIISNAGFNAIHMIACKNVSLTGNIIKYSGNSALVTQICSNLIIENNEINSTGLNLGQNKYGQPFFTGLYLEGTNIKCSNNIIDSTGYLGINFHGDSIHIYNNLISRFCISLDDGGGIYTSGNEKIASNYALIEKNIILYGKEESFGTPESNANSVLGIYLDSRSKYIRIISNTVAYCEGFGIFVHNANNFTIDGNNIYNNTSQLGLTHDEIASDAPIHNAQVYRNIFVSLNQTQLVSNFRTIKNDIKTFGKFSKNFYSRPSDSNSSIYYRFYGSAGTVSNFVNLEGWQYISGQDQDSKICPDNLDDFVSDSIKLFYNPTKKTIKIEDNKFYIDFYGNAYKDFELSSFSSLILIKVTKAVFDEFRKNTKINDLEIYSNNGLNTISSLGGTLQLSVDVKPSYAADTTVTWEIISGNDKATINDNGFIEAINNGVIIVKSTANDGSGLYDLFEIYISGQENILTDMTLYPNPTFGNIRIIADFDLSNVESNSEVVKKIRITDALGKTIYIQDCFSSKDTKIDESIQLPNVSSGLYFVIVQVGNILIKKKLIYYK